jgi:hypothetical protein
MVGASLFCGFRGNQRNELEPWLVLMTIRAHAVFRPATA